MAEVSIKDTEALFRRLVSLGQAKYGLSAVPALRHNLINLGTLLLILLALAGLTYLNTMAPWGFVILMSLGYAYLFVVLVSFVPHEAGHATFIKARSKRVARFFNAFFGRMVCLPFGLSFSVDWQGNHYAHHKEPIVSTDPQIPPERILYGKALYRKALAIMFVPGFSIFSRFVPMQYKKDGKKLAGLGVLLVWSVVIWVCVRQNHSSLLIALYYGLTISSAYGFFKESIEHQREVSSIFKSRTYLFPGHRILMPIHANYHFEHHLNSSIPWYNLPSFHNEIFPIIPEDVRSRIYDFRVADMIAAASGGTRDSMRDYAAGK
jgi:fatty acid desaturase